MDRVDAWASIVSALYMIYGLVQLYNGIISWWLPWTGLEPIQLAIEIEGTFIPNTFPEPFSGIFLVVIGIVFAKAVYLHIRGGEEYRGYVLAGWILAIMMMALNIIVLISDALDSYYPLLWGEEVEEWTLATDPWGIAPHLLLGLLASPLYLSVSDLIRELIPGSKAS